MRILVTVLALVALAIQVFGVQGHVHRWPAAGAAQGIGQHLLHGGEGTHASPGVQRHGVPGEDDPGKCPFCQQLGSSQQLVTCSLALAAFCCLFIIGVVATDQGALALFAARHAWQSRAPPLR